ncbi:hypothetical protein [cf. Phormidesmis sp. LEGE 11477]|uniref:hypothetical protein n=1 Tax=cf. Phormidesmis sp. LEGE 11477 TaxID=1828680 RepID=UPI00187FD551|nr:hypothetical protein [cf. Phormidesmis sp. LEGE 11477]MBE9061938.1 hypothetical protein [cf. Phormidesmis sp. LEGE 11477]
MQNAVKAVSARVKDGQLEVVFSTGMRSLWPISSLQFAKRINGVLTNFYPSEEELVEVEVWPSGEVIEFPRVDQAFQVSALMRGEVGNAEWTRSLTVSVA